MRSLLFTLVVFVTCGWTAGALAQGESAAVSAPVAAAAGAGDASGRAMYEDLEILRRLLAAQLIDELRESSTVAASDYRELMLRRKGYLSQAQSAAAPDAAPPEASWRAWRNERDESSPRLWRNNGLIENEPRVALSSVYLAGYGAVFTAEAPYPLPTSVQQIEPAMFSVAYCGRCHDSSGKSWAESPQRQESGDASEWERIRSQIRGEAAVNTPPPDADSFPVCGPGKLGAAVLRVLAQNGKYLAQLPPGERLTVAVTYAPSVAGDAGDQAEVTPDHAGQAVAAGLEWIAANQGESPRDGSTDQAPLAAWLLLNANAQSSNDPARDYELLGDLHLKQGRTAEAELAFAEALKAFDATAGEFPSDTPYDEVQAKTTAALERKKQLCGKLAQAQLALGRFKEARETLDSTMTLKFSAAPAADATEKSSAQPLPTKLIISAPKELLDQVGNGQISLEEFAGQVSIEHLRFD